MYPTSEKNEANKNYSCCSNTTNNKLKSGCCIPKQKDEACCDKTLTKKENRLIQACC